jgi:hypothetical protein
MSKKNKHSNVNDESGSGRSAAKRSTDQQSQDAMRHQQDASHHKGAQQAKANAATHKGGHSK